MDFSAIISLVAALFCLVLAAAAAFRARRSFTRWSFVLGMLCLGAEAACDGWPGTGTAVEYAQWQTWKLISASLVPGVWLLFTFRYARADETGVFRRWTPLLLATIVLPVGFAWFFRDQFVLGVSQDPSSRLWTVGLRWPGAVVHGVRMVVAIAVLFNIERTFRASIGVIRWRIKYMLLGLAAIFVVRVYTSSQVLFFHGTSQHWSVMEAGALLLGSLLILRALPRAGIFELEIHPSQAVLRHSITISIAGIYLMLVGIGAKLASIFGGAASFSLEAFIVLVGLVMLALVLQSDHMGLFTRRFVSRHFQRPFYDYRSVWHSFSEGTAACVDQADLAQALVRLFAETFQALSVNLWLVDKKTDRLSLAASTALSGTASWNLAPTRRESIQIIQNFKDSREPVDFDLTEGDWALALRRCNPGEFAKKGGHRICVALRGGGDLLGLLTLGDRVGAVPFTDQDFEMLKCAGNHAASGLLNAGLLEKSLQSKELEAFQTMAAFFVHDLKNSAFTLNLMLQNLPIHFDDPAFREDTLRGITKTVAHINNLVSRLNLLRQGFRITPIPADLDGLVTRIVAECGCKPEIMLTTKLNAPASITLDSEQIGKVITNLVLNASEAIEGAGKIEITTQIEGTWAELSVSDTGCGMTHEFREKSLFRAFQTTKKNGLGIGMFQSKMIRPWLHL
jgi:putative PEP-CTERM system histidine kinase